MMQLTKAHVVLAAIVVVLVALFTSVWVKEREARIRAEDVSTANSKLAADLQKTINQRDADVKAQEAKTAEAIKQLTPAAAQQVITRIVTVPGAPVEPVVSVSKQDLQSGTVADKLPDSPSYTVLTQDQTLAAAKNQLQCDLTATKLSACQQDVVDYQKQVGLEKQRADMAENALKGGTKLQRFVHIAAPLGCAIGSAYVGARLSGPQGAFIATAAGGTICAIAF